MSQDSPINFVTLVSSSGHRFILPESTARGSVTLKDTLEGEMEALETETKTVQYEQFGPEIIDKVCEYLVFKEFWSSQENVDSVPDFYERVPVENVLELLLAADYLSV